jgi:DNA processing protein
MEDLGIQAVVFSDDNYPPKLKNCEDAPLVLYVKGEADFRNRRVLGIVGTRKATPYGRMLCEKLVDGLSHLRPLIVSGLALGIDGYAHREALKNGLETAAVLAHGLDRVYPSAHSGLAARIEKQGCLISDYVTGTKPDRENFPSRNRIIAGLCDAVVVVEAAITGGALITADLAASYNRDVFAFPGRVGDLYSAGCNRYIRENRAALIESAADVIAMMNWDDAPKKSKPVQKELFAELPPDEDAVYKLIALSNEMSVDDICAALPMTPSRIASALLGLELKGHLQALPGKVYRAV